MRKSVDFLTDGTFPVQYADARSTGSTQRSISNTENGAKAKEKLVANDAKLWTPECNLSECPMRGRR